MSPSAPDPTLILQDPSWLAHRYDSDADGIQFIHAPRAVHRAATFLIDEYLPEAARPVIVPRAAAMAAAPAPAPLHFIFHSAFCCSTLLARAFDIEGVAMGLKEPTILNDLSGWRNRGAAPASLAAVLDDAMTLLARPFLPGESVIVKPTNLGNPFAAAMLAMRPAARALLLHAPLRLYLGSVAKKGMWGRLWVRELFVKLGRDGLMDYGFSREEVLRQTDLQIAAIGWLAQHRLFAALIERHGRDRVRSLDSEQMLARPQETLAALSALFGLALDDAAVAAIVAGDAFTRHSKDGTAFGRAARQAEQRDAAAVHAEEVDKVAIWAEAVAASAGQPLQLGAGLLR